MYADGLYNSMINDKDGQIPLPLNMFSGTALGHVAHQCQNNKGFHPKAFKSMLKADRPDCSNCFNSKSDGGNNASCCTATGRILLTSPGVTDRYKFLMNTRNTLPESYQQSVYNNTLASVKHQIQQA
jgi:hypothetical protein